MRTFILRIVMSLFLWGAVCSFGSLSWAQVSHPLALQMSAYDYVSPRTLSGGIHKIRVRFKKGEGETVPLTSKSAKSNNYYEFDNIEFTDGFFTLKFGDENSPIPENWLGQKGIYLTVQIEINVGSDEYYDEISIEAYSVLTTKYAETAGGLSLDPTFEGTLRGPNAYFTKGASVNGTVTANYFSGDGQYLTNISANSIVGKVSSQLSPNSITGNHINENANITINSAIVKLEVSANRVRASEIYLNGTRLTNTPQGPTNYLQSGSNLGDLNNIGTARTNLGLGAVDSVVFKGVSVNGTISANTYIYKGNEIFNDLDRKLVTKDENDVIMNLLGINNENMNITINRLANNTTSTNHLTANTVSINSLTMVGFGSGMPIPEQSPFFRTSWIQKPDPFATGDPVLTKRGPDSTFLVRNAITIYGIEDTSENLIDEHPTLYFQNKPSLNDEAATQNAAFIRLDAQKQLPNNSPHFGVLRYQSNSGHMFMVVKGGVGSGRYFRGDNQWDNLYGDAGKDDSIYQFKYYANGGDPIPDSLFNIVQYGTNTSADYVHFTANTDVVGKLANHQAEVLGIAQSGIKLESAGADYAEYLPRQTQGEPMESGDIVGVYAGKITKTTSDAHRVMVISTMPLIVGNWKGKEDPERYEAVTFIGQAPVKIRGAVNAGDYIVPSGQNDGIGIALSKSQLRPKHYSQIVGHAWESNAKTGVKKINMAIVPLMYPYHTQQQFEIEKLKESIQELRYLINTLKITGNKLNEEHNE